MEARRTRSLDTIDEKLQHMDENSLRYKVLSSAKNFKTSWIELGQALYSVWKDKLFRDWGYTEFDSYTSKEIGIRKQTALKLLRSYYFLEKEEPEYLKEGYIESAKAANIPNYDSVDVLRQAKNKKLDDEDYDNLKKEIFEKGKDYREVRKDLVSLMKQRQEIDSEEAREKRRIATVKRFLGILTSLRNEIDDAKLLSASLVKEASQLIKKIEAEIK